jgi:hypothetical protein
MFSCPGDPKVCKASIPLICLVLIGLLQIFPFTVSAEEAMLKKKAGRLEHGARVAILPFENMSGIFLNIDDVMKPFYQNFKKIFSLSYMDKVDEVIWQLRLRHTGFLSSQDAFEIGQRLGVKAVILGMICLYQETPEPSVGLIIKVIGTGEDTPLLWSQGINKSGSQTRSWFGINRINKTDFMIDIVARELVEEMYIDLMQKDDDFE